TNIGAQEASPAPPSTSISDARVFAAASEACANSIAYPRAESSPNRTRTRNSGRHSEDGGDASPSPPCSPRRNEVKAGEERVGERRPFRRGASPSPPLEERVGERRPFRRGASPSPPLEERVGERRPFRPGASPSLPS